MTNQTTLSHESYEVVEHIKSLLLIDGYLKKQLANMVGTTVDRLDCVLNHPEKADPTQAWCQEVNWLYSLHHQPKTFMDFTIDDLYGF